MSNQQSSDFSENAARVDIQQFFSRSLVRLESRLQSVEVKLASLSKVARLLQQYSQKKDQQYEKQSNNNHVLHYKLTKIEEIESQVSQSTHRFEELVLLVHSHTLKLEQLARVIDDKESRQRNFDQKVNYQFQQINRKVQNLHSNLLQFVRDGSKKRQQNNGNNFAAEGQYNFEEMNFKLSLLQNNYVNDFQKLKSKIQKIQLHLKKTVKDDQNDIRIPTIQRQKDKTKPFDRKKSISNLKRIKSK